MRAKGGSAMRHPSWSSSQRSLKPRIMHVLDPFVERGNRSKGSIYARVLSFMDGGHDRCCAMQAHLVVIRADVP